jgi:biotin carboxyl carrier protein
MRYEAEIDGRQLSIELEERDGRVQARVGPREYELEVVSPEAGVYTFLAANRVYEANVWAPERNSFRVLVGGHVFVANIIDRKHRRPAAEHVMEGRQNLVAPMPGKVVRVLVAAGNEVELGQGVVVVEAMKMQNEIKSPKTGRIVEIRVVEGATVNSNQVLAVVE